MVKKYLVLVLTILTLLPLLLFAQNMEEATGNVTGIDLTPGTGLAGIDPDSELFEKIMVLIDKTVRIECFPTDFNTDNSIPQELVIDENGELVNAEKITANWKEYLLTPTAYEIFIDGEEALTSNPILAVDGQIYLPIEEITELLGAGVSINKEKQRIEFTEKNEEIYIPTAEFEDALNSIDFENINYEQMRFLHSVLMGRTRALYPIKERNQGITQMRDAAKKLKVGMSWDEIDKQIGSYTFDAGSGVYIPVYLFDCGELMTLNIFLGRNSGLNGVTNKYGIDLLKTEYAAPEENTPIFINGAEFSTKNPVVTIDKNIFLFTIVNLNQTYLSLEDFSVVLGVEFIVNEQEQKIEVLTSTKEQP